MQKPRTLCGAFVARRGLSPARFAAPPLILRRFALPEGPDSLRSSVFAFIRLAEQARHAPEMQKPRTLCGAFVARTGRFSNRFLSDLRLVVELSV